MTVVDIRTKKELSENEVFLRAKGVPRAGGYIMFWRDQEDGLYKSRYRGAGADLILFCLVYSWMLANSLYPIVQAPREE